MVTRFATRAVNGIDLRIAREQAAVCAKVSLTGQYASVDEDLTGR